MPTTISEARPRSPSRFRIYGPKGLKSAGIDREQRVIVGYAVITRGEALGHGFWVDSEMLDQVVAEGNASSKGIKCRLTHPGLCSDGLGSYLGRSRNFRRDGDLVRADLHLSDVTSKSPNYDQDPADYVMALAEADAEAFGASIVFYHDIGAEDRFRADHSDADGVFISPDSDNERDLLHARLAALVAADLVDEPAANPGGFFSSGEEFAARAENALSWIFGLSDVAPAPEALGGGQPNRIREFVHGFLARHGLSVGKVPPTSGGKETPMPETPKPAAIATPDPSVVAREQFAANLKALQESFPTDEAFAVRCAAGGLSVEQARSQYCSVLETRLAAAETKQAETDAALVALKAENEGIRKELLKGAPPVSHGTEPAAEPDKVKAALAYQMKHKGMKFSDAFRSVSESSEQK